MIEGKWLHGRRDEAGAFAEALRSRYLRFASERPTMMSPTFARADWLMIRPHFPIGTFPLLDLLAVPAWLDFLAQRTYRPVPLAANGRRMPALLWAPPPWLRPFLVPTTGQDGLMGQPWEVPPGPEGVRRPPALFVRSDEWRREPQALARTPSAPQGEATLSPPTPAWPPVVHFTATPEPRARDPGERRALLSAEADLPTLAGSSGPSIGQGASVFSRFVEHPLVRAIGRWSVLASEPDRTEEAAVLRAPPHPAGGPAELLPERGRRQPLLTIDLSTAGTPKRDLPARPALSRQGLEAGQLAASFAIDTTLATPAASPIDGTQANVVPSSTADDDFRHLPVLPRRLLSRPGRLSSGEEQPWVQELLSPASLLNAAVAGLEPQHSSETLAGEAAAQPPVALPSASRALAAKMLYDGPGSSETQAKAAAAQVSALPLAHAMGNRAGFADRLPLSRSAREHGEEDVAVEQTDTDPALGPTGLGRLSSRTIRALPHPPVGDATSVLGQSAGSVVTLSALAAPSVPPTAAIQRAAEAGERPVPEEAVVPGEEMSAETEAEEEVEQREFDLDTLASDVYEILKWRLVVERERMWGVA